MGSLAEIAAALRSLRNRVYLTVGRAVLGQVDDGTKLQTVQLEGMGAEVRDGIERFQQYGFTSVPSPKAEAIALFLQGDRAHGICIAIDDRRYRIKGLTNGEVALYDDLGQKVHLKRTGILVKTTGVIDVEGGSTLTLKATNINLVGNVTAGPASGGVLTVDGTRAKIESAGGAYVDANGANVDVNT